MSAIRAELVDHMGDDLRVVNAARVSFDAESRWENGWVEDADVPFGGYETRGLSERDQGLIRFLARGCESGQWEDHIQALRLTHDKDKCVRILKWARHLPEHWTPFAHTSITLREHCPVPIRTQRFKHTVGNVYNEVSRRYVSADIEVFAPETWRGKAPNKKQGSSGPLDAGTQEIIQQLYHASTDEAVRTYYAMLDHGVCEEQARFVLPQGMMCQYWVTGNLYSFARAYKQRSDSHAQKEIRDLAEHWDRIIRPLFPHSWSALVD